MPSELQRVARDLVAALDEAPRVVDSLIRIAQKCRENASQVGHMSNNPAARTAAVQLDEAARRCDEAAHYLARALSRASGWAEQMASGGRLAEPMIGTSERRRDGAGTDEEPRPPNTPQSERRPVSNEPDVFEPVAREILERLPMRKPSDKTRGIWIDADGHEQDLISGVDEYTADVDEFMEEHGIRIAPGADTLGAHVEVKFAMRMRREGLTDETITINNKPCPGPYGCHRNLWKFLPEGARLTVYGPDNFKRTYPE
jgi:hypothetical protein